MAPGGRLPPQVCEPPADSSREGGATLAREEPRDALEGHIRVPNEALERAGGAVTLETDLPFRPAVTGSADGRVLGLRLFEVAIAR